MIILICDDPNPKVRDIFLKMHPEGKIVSLAEAKEMGYPSGTNDGMIISVDSRNRSTIIPIIKLIDQFEQPSIREDNHEYDRWQRNLRNQHYNKRQFKLFKKGRK